MMKYLIISFLTLLNLSISAQYITDTSLSKNLLLMEIRFWKSTSDSSKRIALIDKAEIYKSLNMHEQALFELGRVEKYCGNQKTIAMLNYEKMLNYFLSNNYNYASNITIPLPDLEQIHKTKEYNTMKLFSLNETEKWEKCKQELLLICPHDDSARIMSIQLLPIDYNFISPEYCSRLSSFIPGLGEIKAGYPIKGATSLLIHSGLIFFTGYNFYTGFYLTGTISGGLPFLKFYSGGKHLSARLAEEHNEKEKKKLKKKYTKIIEEVVQ